MFRRVRRSARIVGSPPEPVRRLTGSRGLAPIDNEARTTSPSRIHTVRQRRDLVAVHTVMHPLAVRQVPRSGLNLTLLLSGDAEIVKPRHHVVELRTEVLQLPRAVAVPAATHPVRFLIIGCMVPAFCHFVNALGRLHGWTRALFRHELFHCRLEYGAIGMRTYPAPASASGRLITAP